MHSSAAVAGRALIMLICIVGIPVVALYGSSWPEMLKKLQNFQWSNFLNNNAPVATASNTGVGEAPRFIPQDRNERPMAGKSAARSASVVPALVSQASAADLGSPASQNAVVPVGFVASNASSGADPSAASDPFRSIQDRLRQLGATYYLLESWGNGQEMYRFYCKMGIGGSAGYVRCFESTDSDPLNAAMQVLRQVETWKEGTRQ